VFPTLLVIATVVAAFAVGALAAWPTVRRLRAQLADAIWRLTRDPLTGLCNRAGLLAAYTALAAGPPQPIAVILIDLDAFKTINDSYGHDRGDDLLYEIGDRIDDTVIGHQTTAARLSGDEFAVVLPTHHTDITDLVEQLLNVIAAPIGLVVDGVAVTVSITASLGVAIAKTTDPLPSVTLRHADIAMYHAKKQGGAGFCLYQPGTAMPTPRHRPTVRRRDRHPHRGREAGA